MQKTATAASPPIIVNISSSQLDIEHPPRIPAAQSARYAFFTANRVVDGTGTLRPKFDKDFDTEQNSDRDVFWPLSRSVGSSAAANDIASDGLHPQRTELIG